MQKLISAVVLAVLSFTMFGYNETGLNEKNQRLSSLLKLTPEEEQAFFLIFNKIEELQNELASAERNAYDAMCDALEKGSPDVSRLLAEYVKAKAANTDQHIAQYDRYIKVLPPEKVIRLYSLLKNPEAGHGAAPDYDIEIDDSQLYGNDCPSGKYMPCASFHPNSLF